MSAIKIAENIYAVGVKDPGLAVFDIVMATKYGTTYNSYLIKGTEKTALIDGVKKEFTDEFLSNIEEIIPVDKIDYLIVNHDEPDHSGAIPAILEKNPQIKLFCSASAVPFLKNIINREADITGFKDKATLELGGKTLEFKLMPYMHWPDTMMEYLHEDKILFSNDGFATHFCSDCLYADEVKEDIDHEFFYYFDSIMRPFTAYIRRDMPKLDEYDIRMIAPSHGPIHRQDTAKYLDRYKNWSVDKSEGKNQITIFYASNYGNTKKMAEFFGTQLEKAGYNITLIDAGKLNIDNAREQIETSKAVMIGTPTFNGDAVAPIWNLVNLFSTVYSVGKKAVVFGSYGWSGEGVKLVAARLTGLKLKVFEENFRARLIPSAEEIKEMENYTKKVVDFIG
ncbi:MAG: FprA family A-type flavoprotein [FCB group bacterium]|nr:FprA family A-type flavoprotein [FCB group bacterium]